MMVNTILRLKKPSAMMMALGILANSTLIQTFTLKICIDSFLARVVILATTMDSGIPESTPVTKLSARMMVNGTPANMKASPKLLMTMESGILASTPAIRRSVPTMASGILESTRESLRLPTMMENGTPESILVARRSVRMMEAGTLASTKVVTQVLMMESGTLENTKAATLELMMASMTPRSMARR